MDLEGRKDFLHAERLKKKQPKVRANQMLKGFKQKNKFLQIHQPFERRVLTRRQLGGASAIFFTIGLLMLLAALIFG